MYIQSKHLPLFSKKRIIRLLTLRQQLAITQSFLKSQVPTQSKSSCLLFSSLRKRIWEKINKLRNLERRLMRWKIKFPNHKSPKKLLNERTYFQWVTNETQCLKTKLSTSMKNLTNSIFRQKHYSNHLSRQSPYLRPLTYIYAKQTIANFSFWPFTRIIKTFSKASQILKALKSSQFSTNSTLWILIWTNQRN